MNYYDNELKESIKNDYVNGTSFDDIISKYNLGKISFYIWLWQQHTKTMG